MFHPERDLRLVILDIIKDDGKSISAISRELEKRGFELHRLILTGYLRAMTDLGVVREKEVPPSKVYAPVKGREGDIYKTIGEGARGVAADEDMAERLILFSLCRLFHRPIFQEELGRAGVDAGPIGKAATKEERQEAKLLLTRSGFKIPDSSKAYVLDDPDLESKYSELLARILATEHDLAYLIRETKQTKLSF
ncbi:MAG TPA: hypothetical protein VMS79_03355 [Methanomassiliicoccales archaeon]|nr:hypothetical protein [Methanomassiliicoccales archaeon]